MAKQIHVAVGVVVNARNEILIALRPDHIHQGGLWEFPGGKVEAGESVQQALARELNEELAIKVLGFKPLLVVEHDYGDKHVKLDTWVVNAFEGEPKGAENQPIRWVSVEELPNYAFPEANKPIVESVLSTLTAPSG